MQPEEVTIRTATRADVPAIVTLLADDPLGAMREDPSDLAPYLHAFDDMTAQGGNEILVAERAGPTAKEVVGCLQLTLIPGLSRHAAKRGLIEGVRVSAARRGLRIGEHLIRHAIEASRAAGCGIVQLT